MAATDESSEFLEIPKKEKVVFNNERMTLVEVPTDADKKEMLKNSIREQNRIYRITNNIYDQLRVKALALIAGEVTILTALFSGWRVKATLHSGDDRIFFFCTGIVFCGLAFGVLLWIISTVPWKVAHDFTKSGAIYKDKNRNTSVSFLEHLHDDYCTVNEYCAKIVTEKCIKFNWTIFLLAAGVIILMVIKFGGPQ